MNFLGTHDTERILSALSNVSIENMSNDEIALYRLPLKEREEATKRLKMAYVALATLPGVVMLFYGDEMGMEGYKDPFNRLPFPWNSGDQNIYKFIQTLFAFRRNHTIYKNSEFLYKFAIFDNIRDKNIKEFIYKDTFIKLEHSAMAIILHDDEIVVTYERIYTDTAISLPKGHIEKNETIIDAAIREAKEEAGIIVSRDDIIGEAESYATHYITPNDTEIVKIIYPIIFKINERRSINITEKRIEKVVYMKLKDFYKLCSYSNIRDIVKKIKK